MAKPAKKSAPKKATKKSATGKAGGGKPAPAKKADAKAPARQDAAATEDQSGATPYTPKPIEGVGWPAFRYPPQ